MAKTKKTKEATPSAGELQAMVIQRCMIVPAGHQYDYIALKSSVNDLPSVIKDVVTSPAVIGVRILNKKEDRCFLDLRDVNLNTVEQDALKLYEIGEVMRTAMVTNESLAALKKAFSEWRSV